MFTKNLKLEKPPKHPRVLSITIEAELCGCPEASTHVSTFCYSDCTAEVFEGEKNIGNISCGLGATVFLHDQATQYRYVISPDSLWPAFQKALKETHGDATA